MSCGDIFLGLIAVLFPPIAVWIKRGLCSADSFINILLCVLGYLPGLIHAWYIIARYPEHDYDYEPIDSEGQRVTYVVVGQGQGSDRNYGTQGRQAQPKPVHPPSVPAHSRPAPNDQGPSNRTADNNPPPTYQDAVKGDHKIQNQN